MRWSFDFDKPLPQNDLVYYSYMEILIPFLFILWSSILAVIIILIVNFYRRPTIYFASDNEGLQDPGTNAGYDLSTLEDVVIPPFGSTRVLTNVAINIPPGYYGQIKERSSVAMNGIVIPGGVIDAGYTKILSVILVNTTNREQKFAKHERVAQIIFHRLPRFVIKQTRIENFPYRQRGEKGFGSSGR